jgi:hypothetical protein
VLTEMPTSFLAVNREAHRLCPPRGAEGCKVTLVQEGKMVDPTRVVAGKAGELPDRRGDDWSLALTLAANKDRHAAEIDENLRRAPCHRIGGNRGAEHLHIPILKHLRAWGERIGLRPGVQKGMRLEN